jgi:hypothetical protein
VALALGTFCVSVPVTRTRPRHAQAVGGHLGHLGVQALAHLGAAVVHADAAVLVDMTSAPPWFSMVAVNEMPNFSGVERQAALARAASPR